MIFFLYSPFYITNLMLNGIFKVQNVFKRGNYASLFEPSETHKKADVASSKE